MIEKDILIPENFAVDEAAELRENFYKLIEKGEKHFKLNFSECTFIDSTGLGVLVSVYKRCMEKDGSFKLYSVNPQVMKIFKLTRLDRVFQID
jgi:anti-sigma B factor antagonist